MEQCTAITPYEYELLKEHQRKNSSTIVVRVVTFAYNYQIFNVKMYQGKNGSRLPLLHLETDLQAKDIKMPNFLIVSKEVTGDPAFKSQEICARLF